MPKITEFKRLSSIAAHFPRKGGIGVDKAYVLRLIKDNQLPLDSFDVDGTTYYIISEQDQLLPDWGLSLRLVRPPARQAGRKKGSTIANGAQPKTLKKA